MSKDNWYCVENVEELPSPAFLLWPDRIEQNIQTMLSIVDGNAESLRPHVKTHKLGEVVKMQIEAGINKFKCATIAEAEMVAESGAAEVLVAYQPVGPNVSRMLALKEKFPDVEFATLVDDEGVLSAVSECFSAAGKTLKLFLDVNCGMDRSGIVMGDEAVALCRKIIDAEGVEFGGLHVYDGHIHDADLNERQSNFNQSYEPLAAFVENLKKVGVEVSLIVTGGSPTFALHAGDTERVTGVKWEFSPGTTTLWDAGYGPKFPDLNFAPAAMLLIRVISKPAPGLVCLDLGHKAVAGERPLESRVQLFGILADSEPIGQSEEHLVVKTSRADEISVGDVVYGMPNHICPTTALHMEAVIIREGRASGERWIIRARDRRLTI